MIFDIFLTIFLVFLNGFFVAAEFAIVKVRASQLEIKAQQGNRFAALGKHVVSHLDAYLAATQLGITIASLGLGWIGEPVVSKIILSLMAGVGIQLSPEAAHAIALPVAFSIITTLHIVFGELAPKSIAIQKSELTTLSVVYPLHFFFTIFKPVIWLLNGIANVLLSLIGLSQSHESDIHSRDELKYLILQGKESGIIKSEHFSIIKNAFDFSEMTAKEIMVPRANMVTIDLSEFREGSVEKVLEDGYSRIPCHEKNSDNIVGLVSLKDLMKASRKSSQLNIREIVRPVLFVPEAKKIGKLLREFQLKHEQIAIVVNEFGATVGLLTMEDILEELVGEIQDELDFEINPVEKIDENTFFIIGSTGINTINAALPRPIEKTGAYETLAGYLLDKFGRIPNANEKIVADDYEFTIMKRSKTSIALVQLRKTGK